MSRSDGKLTNVRRRALLKGLVIGGVSLVPLAGHALRAPESRRRGGSPLRGTQGDGTSPMRGLDDGRPPWWLIAPVRRGSYVGSGWRVQSLSRIEQGAAVLTLAHLSGKVAAVHLCRRAGLPRGLAHTPNLDLYLMNDGDGELPTPEGVGRAVKTVAMRITRRERQEQRFDAPRGMMSHWARVRWYGTPGSVV